MKTFLRKLKLIWFIIFSNNTFEVKGKDISDGYHTFGELYEHRMLYNAAFCKIAKELKSNEIKCFKSNKHSDNTPCFDGTWFIVSMELPTGQISNHYKKEYFDLFDVQYVPNAPIWDGHTTQIALERLKSFARKPIKLTPKVKYHK